MKTFVCSCGRKREVEDYIIIVVCYRCQKEMQEVREDEK